MIRGSKNVVFGLAKQEDRLNQEISRKGKIFGLALGAGHTGNRLLGLHG